MRILVITQKVDINDDLLGFFVAWLKELARHVERVDVITLAHGDSSRLPENVHIYSLAKEHGSSKLQRFLLFYKYLWQLTPQTDKIFAHMSPIFVIASWPIALLWRKKIILWYVHRSVTLKLRLATLLSSKILTVARESFRLKSDKVVITGHGIDTEYFTRTVADAGERICIISVGRITPIKNYETLLGAAKILKEKACDFTIRIVGRPVMSRDWQYEKQLKEIVQRDELGMIEFTGFVPYSQIVDYYHQANLAINLAPTGGLDKAVLEAMSCGIPVLVSNQAFAEYLGPYTDVSIFEFNNAQDLAEHIQRIVKLDQQEIGDYMRKVILNYHTISQIIGHIINE